MTHVLFLSYDGLTDTLGQSQVLPYIIGLSEQGYQYTIISAEKKDNYTKREKIINELIEGYDIKWIPIFYTKKPPVISTLLDIRKLNKLAKKIHQEKPIDILHCRSYISALVGQKLKRKHPTVKMIFDMRGFWADERVDGGLWDIKSPIFSRVYKYFKKKEKEYLKEADYTISLTHNAKNEIQSWNGFENTPIQVIPCCVDTELFDYRRAPQKPQGHVFTISYLGSIGTWYLLEEMLLFYKALLEKRPETQFLFITTERADHIMIPAQKMGLPIDQIRVQSAERKQVPVLLGQSDLSIFFIKNAFSKKASSATKMGEILAMGIPIIANTEMGDHDYLFEKYTCGLLTEEFTTKAYEKIVDQVDELLLTDKSSLRHTAEDYFSLDKGLDLYEKVYKLVRK